MKKWYSFLISAALLCSNFVYTTQISIKTMSGQTYHIETAQGDTISSLKTKLRQQYHLPPEQIKLVHNGTFLNDDKTLDHLSSSTVVHLIISLSLAKNQKYGEAFTRRVSEAKTTLDDLKRLDNLYKLSKEEFYIEMQTYNFYIQDLFKYDLPEGFFLEVADKFNTELPGVFSDDDLKNPVTLLNNAKWYLYEDHYQKTEQQVLDWKENQKSFKEYLKLLIAYKIALHKACADQNTNNVYDRFFTVNDCRDFIDLHDEKNPNPRFATYQEKFNKVRQQCHINDRN